ncbi:MAG: hypothetical protein IJX36_05070, partial [Thermoguttaceae bacterium]|nr:hypothetical protein [Thermoguttaceae bacterium]
MYFISTRGGEKVTGAEAIVKGLANDGGLFVPEYFPTSSKTCARNVFEGSRLIFSNSIGDRSSFLAFRSEMVAFGDVGRHRQADFFQKFVGFRPIRRVIAFRRDEPHRVQ